MVDFIIVAGALIIAAAVIVRAVRRKGKCTCCGDCGKCKKLNK